VPPDRLTLNVVVLCEDLADEAGGCSPRYTVCHISNEAACASELAGVMVVILAEGEVDQTAPAPERTREDRRDPTVEATNERAASVTLGLLLAPETRDTGAS
jgi:hypothetical protein